MHREYKLKMTKQEIITSISEHVSYARNKFNRNTDDIMFSPEDGMRTEEEFLFEAINAAIKA
jgi:2-isopropylmalate synthase